MLINFKRVNIAPPPAVALASEALIHAATKPAGADCTAWDARAAESAAVVVVTPRR